MSRCWLWILDQRIEAAVPVIESRHCRKDSPRFSPEPACSDVQYSVHSDVRNRNETRFAFSDDNKTERSSFACREIRITCCRGALRLNHRRAGGRSDGRTSECEFGRQDRYQGQRVDFERLPDDRLDSKGCWLNAGPALVRTHSNPGRQRAASFFLLRFLAIGHGPEHQSGREARGSVGAEHEHAATHEEEGGGPPALAPGSKYPPDAPCAIAVVKLFSGRSKSKCSSSLKTIGMGR